MLVSVSQANAAVQNAQLCLQPSSVRQLHFDQPFQASSHVNGKTSKRTAVQAGWDDSCGIGQLAIGRAASQQQQCALRVLQILQPANQSGCLVLALQGVGGAELFAPEGGSQQFEIAVAAPLEAREQTGWDLVLATRRYDLALCRCELQTDAG